MKKATYKGRGGPMCPPVRRADTQVGPYTRTTSGPADEKRPRRRKWIVVVAIGVTFAMCEAVAQAQPQKIPRLGLLSPFSPDATAVWHQAFRQGLRDLGYVEGKNILIEYRYAEGKSDRLPGLAAELVRLKVNIIVASVNTDALAAKNATKEIPIVVASGGDPVAIGLVESLAHPGGNVTGMSQISPELAGKRLELLKEIVHKLSRVAVLWNPQGTTSPLAWKEIQLPARALKIQLHSLEVSSADNFQSAFKEAVKARSGALAIMPDPLFAGNLKQLADLAAKSRLPSMFHLTEFVDAGGLVAYGVDRSDQFRRAATFVDKILKGRTPADLPVEQPMRFELVFNLNAAKRIGLTIPPNVLVRAQRVIR